MPQAMQCLCCTCCSAYVASVAQALLQLLHRRYPFDVTEVKRTGANQ